MVADAPSAVRGSELRAMRAAWRVSLKAVAERMGVSRQRAGRIEATEYPTSEARDRYLAALEKAQAAR